MLSSGISSLHILISQTPSHKERDTHKLHTCHLTHADFTILYRTKREGHTHFRGTRTFQRDTHISEGHTHFRGTNTFHRHHHRTREGHTKLAGTTTWKERRTQPTSQILSHKGEGHTKHTAMTSVKEGHAHCKRAHCKRAHCKRAHCKRAHCKRAHCKRAHCNSQTPLH